MRRVTASAIAAAMLACAVPCLAGEAWPDIAAQVLPSHPSAWIFFVIFILVSTFVALNLFTAVVVSAMEPERREEIQIDATILDELRLLRAEIAALREGGLPLPQQAGKSQ